MIAKLAVLAFYMPIIAGMGGNASAQAMAVAVRGLALGRVDRGCSWRVMYRQFLVGLLTGRHHRPGDRQRRLDLPQRPRRTCSAWSSPSR